MGAGEEKGLEAPMAADPTPMAADTAMSDLSSCRQLH
jgi:hypothetical protein